MRASGHVHMLALCVYIYSHFAEPLLQNLARVLQN